MRASLRPTVAPLRGPQGQMLCADVVGGGRRKGKLARHQLKPLSQGPETHSQGRSQPLCPTHPSRAHLLTPAYCQHLRFGGYAFKPWKVPRRHSHGHGNGWHLLYPHFPAEPSYRPPTQMCLPEKVGCTYEHLLSIAVNSAIFTRLKKHL